MPTQTETLDKQQKLQKDNKKLMYRIYPFYALIRGHYEQAVLSDDLSPASGEAIRILKSALNKTIEVCEEDMPKSIIDKLGIKKIE